jgi:hypothetical protein
LLLILLFSQLNSMASITAARSRDLALDYLKATLVLIVVAHHGWLAYTTFAHFDPARPLASTAPVVDTARWWFFDYAENFNDVFFMSLMFFVSGSSFGLRCGAPGLLLSCTAGSSGSVYLSQSASFCSCRLPTTLPGSVSRLLVPDHHPWLAAGAAVVHLASVAL